MQEEIITMAHGSGGAAGHELMKEVLLPAFDNKYLREMHDGAKLDLSTNKIAFTTDSYVVKPLFFAGGNIGKLAVCGTVNDLAMTGAVAKYISVGMIIEEGFPIKDLREIVSTMRRAADEAGIYIVTGDTKVVNKGSADGIFINTAGVGERIDNVDISPLNAKAGQNIIVSGYLGDHAATIMASRHNLELPDTVKTDCAPLNHMVKEMLTAVPNIAVLRDPTRGGTAAVLNEIAEQAKVGILLEEETYNNYLKLKENLLQRGYYININSGYRTFNESKNIYNSYAIEKGESYAEKYVAKPGTSEHNTGLAFDFSISNKKNSYKTNYDSDEYFYLENIAYLYGFIIRYPKGKEKITGYSYEPWHLRYVGKELAKYLKKNNLTLEEYYE